MSGHRRRPDETPVEPEELTKGEVHVHPAVRELYGDELLDALNRRKPGPQPGYRDTARRTTDERGREIVK